MKKLIVPVALLFGCAPISPSISKSNLCQIPSEYMSRYNSVQERVDSWTSVKTIMGEEPTTVEQDVQTYVHCKKMVFTFYGSVLVVKQIK